jgi:class 3 adenylate cyclase
LPNGDVIEKHDVFGDGVNIAARLEQVAPPGGLCPSEDAYRQVPVMLPPGCDRPATRSVAHRITHEPMTTGIDVVACYAARGHGDGDIDFEADKFGLKREERG